MTLRLIAAPGTEPITRAQAALYVKQDGSDDNDILDLLITTARGEAEHLLGRALIQQTWERVLDCFPWAEIELGMPPIASITSVKYTDTAGAEQTFDANGYVLDSARIPGWVLPADGYSWPATADTVNAVRVRFVCGYGTNATDVPAPIRTWISMRVATLYDYRQDVAAGVSVAQLPSRHMDRLLDPYTVHAV